MFQVIISSKSSRDIKDLKKEGLINNNDLQVIKAWVKEMSLLGPQYISSCGYWNDHALKGKRSSERSSSFSESGRIIYKISKNKVTIRVVKITPDHNYE